mgnify:CR=1 FL=1
MGELDYKPNSQKYKAEQKKDSGERKKVEKVVTGKVKTKKKSEVSKIKDTFISEDISNVKSYIFMDVLVPAAKKAISDIVRDGIDMLLYGDTRRDRRSTGASYVSYRSYSDRDRRDNRRISRPQSRYNYDYDDIILESRSEAEEVLDRMSEILDNYDFVSIADLYDLIGKSCNFTDNRYGWSNLRDAEVVKVYDGYLLKFPKAKPRD